MATELYEDAHGNTFQLEAKAAKALGYKRASEPSSDKAGTGTRPGTGSDTQTKKEPQPASGPQTKTSTPPTP